MRMTPLEKRFVNRADHTRLVAERALQLLHRIDYRDGWRYLDVGCGVGSAAREIAVATGLSVTGIDIDPGQIEIARNGPAKPNLNYQVMDATRLEFGDGEFDIVASQMATHHVPDWEKVLSELSRVLRVGGFLIYRDFMFPAWLGRVGRYLFPFMGFPSIEALHAAAVGAGLTSIFESREARKVNAIWVRNS